MDTIWRPELAKGVGPKYKAVAESIRRGVSEGALAVGQKLPPVRDLAWTLGITPGTVARAYTILTDEGVLTAEVGRGTFVAELDLDPSTRPLNLIEIDATPHQEWGDTDEVNLFSPHLPSRGQAGLIRGVLAEVAQDPPSGVMHYPSRRGAKAARQAMLSWLGDAPIGAVNDDDLVLTLGGQNGIMLVLQTILRGRKPVVFVEELSYPGFRRAAEALRAEVVSVPMDAEGLIPEGLEAAIARHPEGQVLCTSPEVHSPTTLFTPTARRRQIARIVEKHDLQVIDDDCYRMGAVEGESYRSLLPERGWYVTSLSKSITPALRVGAVVAPRGRGSALHRMGEYSFFGLATPMIDLVAKLLVHSELPEVMRGTRLDVERYVQVAVNTLGGFDLRWRRDVPFLWLRLPEGWRASAFCLAAEKQGVQLRAAEEFADRDANAPHAVRMAINAGVSLRSFEAAMQRLRDLLDNPQDQIGV